MLGKLLLGQMLSASVGLLVIRIGAGGTMAALHGFGKLTAGTERWRGLGSALADFGVPESLYVPMGFMAMFAEFFGSILVAIGLFTRVGAFLLVGTMAVANHKHGFGDDFNELALVYLIIFAGLMITGPGSLSLDHWWFGRKSKMVG